MPQRVISLIHWQALQLWLKRVPFYHKPPFVPGDGARCGMSEALARRVPAGAPARARARRAERIVLRALDRVEGGTIELRASGRRASAASATGRPVARRGDRAATSSGGSLWRPRLGLGESYVAGDWHADDLPRLFELLIATRRAPGAASRRLAPARALPPARLRRARASPRAPATSTTTTTSATTSSGSSSTSRSTYSCADLGATARRSRRRSAASCRRVCEKLALGPDDHVLEIGCGWGSFAIHAAAASTARASPA